MFQAEMIVRNLLVISFGLFAATLADNENCPSIQTRSSWSERLAKAVAYLVLPLPYVVIQHTVTPGCFTLEACKERVRNIQSYHMNELDWDDIGYSFLIGGDGNIYEGVSWNKEGAHTYRWNKKSAGIAFIGNFQETVPSRKMLDAARKLIDCGKAMGSLRDNVKVIGARQVRPTLSPGDELYAKIKNWSDWTSTV